MAPKSLTQDRLQELLTYHPTTGEFRWKANHGRKIKADKLAGYTDALGYQKIQIDGSTYAAHRLAWLYAHGVWPPKEIDHINRLRNDNRLVNLRLADRTLNTRNVNKRKDNTSDTPGVYLHGQRQRWCAQISIKGRNNHLGLYNSYEDAVQARKIAEIILGWP